MHPKALEFLMCPECGSFPFEVKDGEEIKGDILSGSLVCLGCGCHYPITEGIPSLLIWRSSNSEQSSLTLNGSPGLIQQAEMMFRDNHAAGYDQSQDPNQRKVEIDTVLHELQMDGKHNVLDVGCGTGRALMSLIGYSSILVGVDFSLDSLKLLRSKLQGINARHVHLIHADATSLPLQSNKFDRTVSVQLLQGFPSVDIRSAVLKNIIRVTRTGGRFVLSVFHYSLLKRVRRHMLRDPGLDVYEREGLHRSQLYYHNFTARELVDLLQEAGFVPLRKYGVNTPLTRRFGKWGAHLERMLGPTSLTMPFAHWIAMSSIRP